MKKITDCRKNIISILTGGGDDSEGCPSYPGDSDSPGEGDGSSGEGSGD